MISLSSVKTLASNSLGRTGLVLSKHSPEIMLGVGIVGVVVGTVLACKATLKLEGIVDETKETLNKIEDAREQHNDEVYSEADYKRDTAIVYVRSAVEIGKLYLPAIAITGAGIGLIIGSHHILTKRNAAIAAAYKLVNASFEQYRQRVRAEYGDEADQRLRLSSDIDQPQEAGAKKKAKKALGPNSVISDISPYAATFAQETSTQYQTSYTQNHYFLRAQQNYANDLLNARGHLFLNEVYDMLSLKRTPAGAIVGWVKGENKNNPNNDQYVDFGLVNPINEERQDAHEAMYQPWYLDFNVDGNIYDLIG